MNPVRNRGRILESISMSQLNITHLGQIGAGA